MIEVSKYFVANAAWIVPVAVAGITLLGVIVGQIAAGRTARRNASVESRKVDTDEFRAVTDRLAADLTETRGELKATNSRLDETRGELHAARAESQIDQLYITTLIAWIEAGNPPPPPGRPTLRQA